VIVVDLGRRDAKAGKDYLPTARFAFNNFRGNFTADREIERRKILIDSKLYRMSLPLARLVYGGGKTVTLPIFNSSSKLEGLKIVPLCLRFQAVLLELFCYILGRPLASGRARAPPLQLVRGKVFNMTGDLIRAHARSRGLRPAARQNGRARHGAEREY